MLTESALGSPLLQGLNPEQAAAVTLPTTHALILAGAGSGKTRVLTTRIAWLLQTGQISPAGVLAVTFTNKAAKELVARLSAMLPINIRRMWIGTFHGLCNRLLRTHHQLAGLSASFQILDTQDQLSAIKRLCKQFGVDSERYPPKQLMWFIASCKEDGQRPKDVPVHDEDSRKKVELYALYEAQCQREGVVDFGELMLRSYELLRDNLALREHYQRRFRHILIDEFQDTNKLQYAWIKMLAGQASPDAPQANTQGSAGLAPGSVIAVGDDDQSIYAFRGARVGNMADFLGDFKVQHQIKLERNYRSFGNILDCANALIEHNTKRLGKNLSTQAGPGEPVRVYEAPSDFSEAHWLVEEIQQLVASGTPRQEIALLYRSNAQSRVIETALFNAGLPYRVYGGLRFFERAEIKHALAYLRLLENAHDDTSFLRVVNFPARGIGARSLEQLQDTARSLGCSLWDAVGAMTGKAGVHLQAFLAKIEVLREQMPGLKLRQIISLVLLHSGLKDHYQGEKEGQDRLENLDELMNAAESFVSIEGFGHDAVAWPVGVAAQNPDFDETLSPLAAFLSHAALESGDNQAQAGQDAVQLMTVHASKGLEFNCVFISGLEEGLFPHENAMLDSDGLEEERRLMYVAMTRARQRLYLSHAQTRMLHGQTRYHLKSRFFKELPETSLKWISSKTTDYFAPIFEASGASSNWATSLFSSKVSGENRINPALDPAQRQTPEHGLKVGLQVFHAKFGEGKVLTLEGPGRDARAQINFTRYGVKWLAVNVAKLTVVT